MLSQRRDLAGLGRAVERVARQVNVVIDAEPGGATSLMRRAERARRKLQLLTYGAVAGLTSMFASGVR